MIGFVAKVGSQVALGRQPGDLLKSGGHDESFSQEMWQKLEKREHWQGEIINRHKDGSIYNADLNISPVIVNIAILWIGIRSTIRQSQDSGSARIGKT